MKFWQWVLWLSSGWRRCLGVCVCLSVGAANGTVAAPLCAGAVPQLVVNPLWNDAPQLDHNRTQSYIQALAGLQGASFKGSTFLALGLTVTEIRLRSQMNTEIVAAADGCVVERTLTVSIGFPAHMVYIPAAFSKGSCAYNLIYAHEMRHVQTDWLLLDDAVARVRSRLIPLLPVLRAPAQPPAADAAPATPQHKQQIEAVLRAVQTELMRERQARQSQVDTTEEYTRLQTECGNLAPLLARERHSEH
jgi:hypothetical protein